MKLKMNFKQTRATSAGDINSPNLLVCSVVHVKPGPRVTKLFSCTTQLNMPESLNAHKNKNIKKLGFFRVR